MRRHRLMEEEPTREVDDELDFHLQQRTSELRAQGVPESEARRRAEAEFGDVIRTRRYCADQDRRRLRRRRLEASLRTFADEARLAYRALARRPGDVAAPVAILAAAITLNVLVFTVVRGVLLSPLPFSDPGRVTAVHELTEQYGLSLVSFPVLDAWRRQARSVDDVSAYLETEFVWQSEDGTVRVPGASVAEGFFDLFDAPMLLGRPLTHENHQAGAAPTALISEGLWRRAFAADPKILDSAIELDGQRYPVLGVVRRAAAFPDGVDVWVSLEATQPQLLDVAGAKILGGLARLRPGTTPEEAARELGEISAKVPGGAPAASAVPMAEQLRRDVRTPLLLLQGAVLLVLLAACANAGGMLLARGVRRRTELAVRTSLGASPRRVAGGLLLEGALLGLGAGVVGLGVAALALKPALTMVPTDLPRAGEIHLDPTVALLALALALVTGVATALLPAASGSRSSPGVLLREATPGGGSGAGVRRVMEGFVVAQVALAVLLTVGSGLLLRSFVATVREDPGFDAAQVTAVRVVLPSYRYPGAPSRLTFAHELLRRAQALPGATAVALSGNVPLSGSNMTSPLLTQDNTTTSPAQIALVSAGYFDVMGIPILAGRSFGDDDREEGPPALIVDPGIRTPDGTALSVGDRAHSFFGTPSGPDSLRDVVGVVGAVRHDGLRAAPPPSAYEPFFQKGGAAGFTLLVRSSAPTGTVVGQARALLTSLDPAIPADRISTMSDVVRRSVAKPRFYTAVLALFGGLAVVLALAGCQAGLAHRVAARRREIGLRMALGASRTGVRKMVLRRGLTLTAAGAVCGLIVSIPATRLLQSQLYGVSAGDPLTYIVLLALLFAAAALASDLPARRAARVEPAETLKEG